VFAIDVSVGTLASFLLRLQPILVGGRDQLGLGSFELIGRLVALLHQIVEILRVGGHPYSSDCGAKHASQSPLIQVLLRDGGEEHSA